MRPTLHFRKVHIWLPLLVAVLLGTLAEAAEPKKAPEPLWPFSIQDEKILFGPKGLRALYGKNDLIFLWDKRVREFASLYKTLDGLEDDQANLLEQINSDMFMRDNNVASSRDDEADKMTKAFKAGAKTATEISLVQHEMREKVDELAAKAKPIRNRLLDLRSRLEKAAKRQAQKPDEESANGVSTKRLREYKIRIIDAADILADVARDPKNNKEYLMAEIRQFAFFKPGRVISPYVEFVNRKLINISTNQSYLRYMVSEDRSEIKRMTVLMEDIMNREERLNRLVETDLEAEKRAREEAEAKAAQAEKKASEMEKDNPPNVATAPAGKESEAVKRAEQETREVKKALTEAEHKALKATKARDEAERMVEEGERTLTKVEKIAQDEAEAREDAERKVLEVKREKTASEIKALEEQQAWMEEERARVEAERKALAKEKARAEADRKALAEERAARARAERIAQEAAKAQEKAERRTRAEEKARAEAERVAREATLAMEAAEKEKARLEAEKKAQEEAKAQKEAAAKAAEEQKAKKSWLGSIGRSIKNIFKKSDSPKK